MKRLNLAGLLLLCIVALMGCVTEPESVRNTGGAIAIGSGASAPPASQPMAPPIDPMLNDPEAQTETWSDYVWADSEIEARRKCESLAQKATQDGGTTVTVIGVKKVGSGKKYECTFQGEVE
ncbi:MAG: hypothetical protein HC840_24095 [Leptolyngbyaceae cyanobacterium RM2_2_4]|nr:hypothetical protein [Leptolyngbyaceae cyanobacterium SM1_4_3]NJO51982.1 hypothetical protein [Leptolyngbyaceae cyanobacterium RM2_2_4]NJO76151.1 hypothetical protein [Leptolyngbyaceae cyanobacterium RM1_406_9]